MSKEKINLFYPSKSERGKSVIVATRVTPETNVAIERIVESVDSPWRSKSEFVRDAVANFIERYAGQDDLLPQVLLVIRKLQERNFRSEVKERIAETVCSSSKELSLYSETKEYTRLVEELEDICSIVLSLRDDPFWLKLTIMQFMEDSVIADAFATASEMGLKPCTAEVLRIFDSMEI